MKENVIQPEILNEISNDIRKTNPKLFLEAFSDEDAREVLKKMIAEEYGKILDTEERLNYVIQEMVGLGIFETIYEDENVTDIQFNGTELIVISRNKPPYVYDEVDIDENYIIKIIQKFANAVGKEFTPKDPILDAQLDYFRLNAVHKVLSPYGTTMSLRASRQKLVLTKDTFQDFAPMYMYHFLKAMVEAKSNIILAGETGAGKTELQKLLISFIQPHEVVIVIEDVQEGHYKTLFKEKNIFSWLSTSNEVLVSLIEAGLRNNPDWLSVTEVRNHGAYQMYTGILTGHHIITSVHSINARAIPNRFVKLIKSSFNVDEKDLMDDLNSYLDLGIYQKKEIIDGNSIRYLSEVVEFRPDGNHITIFKQTLTKDGFVVECNPYSEDIQKKLNEARIDYNFDYLREWENEEENILT